MCKEEVCVVRGALGGGGGGGGGGIYWLTFLRASRRTVSESLMNPQERKVLTAVASAAPLGSSPPIGAEEILA